jgi:hypothetical protein
VRGGAEEGAKGYFPFANLPRCQQSSRKTRHSCLAFDPVTFSIRNEGRNVCMNVTRFPTTAGLASVLLGGILTVPLAARPADLAHIDRQIAKEPHYQHKPKYALAVFGTKAQFKVWLVLDGEVLYADTNGNGDLTAPEKRFTGKKANEACDFKVGDIKVGDQIYRDLTVRTDKLSHQSSLADLPAYQKITAADANARSYFISVDVPTSLNLTDEKGRKVTHISHLASEDANGFLCSSRIGRPTRPSFTLAVPGKSGRAAGKNSCSTGRRTS